MEADRRRTIVSKTSKQTANYKHRKATVEGENARKNKPKVAKKKKWRQF